MPGWLYFIIKMAISIGSPILLEFIKKWAISLPKEVQDLIDELVNNLKNPNTITRQVQLRAFHQLKKCRGNICPPEVKKD